MTEASEVRYDNSPQMLAARLGVRTPREALGHDDVRHDILHRRAYAQLVAHLEPCSRNDPHRCGCRGAVVGTSCCNRADAEDGVCSACRRYCGDAP